MPKKLINDYIFYKIVCLNDDIELCYVGSTANWIERQRSHKSVCNNENNKLYNSNIYKIIRENGGWANFKMVQVGTREQLTKRQAEAIEDEYRVELKANMNTIRCYRSEEQIKEENKQFCKKRYENNKEYYLKTNKIYRENNKEKITEQRKEYRENNKEAIAEHRKEYNIRNNEEILKKKNEFYHNNKEKIKEYKSKKVTCECGCIIGICDLARHKKTKKHLALMKDLE